jgi:GTP-binding protein HflX
VHINFRSREYREGLEEFIELARSAGAHVAAVVTGSRELPEPRLFVGSGKAREILDRVRDTGAALTIFNHDLSPAQERNLERFLSCRVLDRSGLILDIFAQRARTYEGKLQVELAQLQHLATRLVRGWTHLERQRGGIGLRGPGETQLETDRRLIGRRIKTIHTRLEKVRSQRQQGRRLRRRSALPQLSLVGYTNTGKSTLFNRLTGARVYAADKLFATLDPTVRRCALGGGRRVILSDTVGFLRHLPHQLIAAFRATLEEVREADLLLHVIDATDGERETHFAQVNAVLAEIGAGQIPQIEVYNKIDAVPCPPRREFDELNGRYRVWLSARTGAGVELLESIITEHAFNTARPRRLRLPPAAGRLRARLFDYGAVRREVSADGGGWIVDLEITDAQLRRLCAEAGVDPEQVLERAQPRSSAA